MIAKSDGAYDVGREVNGLYGSVVPKIPPETVPDKSKTFGIAKVLDIKAEQFDLKPVVEVPMHPRTNLQLYLPHHRPKPFPQTMQHLTQRPLLQLTPTQIQAPPTTSTDGLDC